MAQTSEVKVAAEEDGSILHVYLPHDFPYTSNLFGPTAPKGRKFMQTQSQEAADILMRVEGQKIVIQHLRGSLLEGQRETCFSLDGNPARLPSVVDGIAHFNYLLTQRSAKPLGGVALEMHRLVGQFPLRRPDLTIGNLVHKGEVHLLQEDAKYGFTIKNTSKVDLFPYLFYLDPGKYTIRVSVLLNEPAGDLFPSHFFHSAGIRLKPYHHCGETRS
jgi:hypothetical protein